MGEPKGMVHGDHGHQRLCAARQGDHCRVRLCGSGFCRREFAIRQCLGVDRCTTAAMAGHGAAVAGVQRVDGGLADRIALPDGGHLKRDIIGLISTDDELGNNMF